jgi:hypothetical protein
MSINMPLYECPTAFPKLFAEAAMATPVVFILDCLSLLVVTIEEAPVDETLGVRPPEGSEVASAGL